MDLDGGWFRSFSGLRLTGWLPRGAGLDAAAWAARHRGICLLLWAHVLLLPLVAVVRDQSYVHGLTEGAVVSWLALAAEVRSLGPRLRSAAATGGLVVSSAVVVHLYDGVIEAHFHFFVMVAVVALYQAWQPFLLALAFVVIHHSVVGSLVPRAVYNHEAATGRPFTWGLVHGVFILAESIACLVYWRASEQTVSREREARIAAEKARQDLADAQQLAGIGSWEWNAGAVAWSDQLYELAGVDRSTFVPSVRSFLELIHPDDQERVAHLIDTSLRTGSRLDYECRLLRADGEVRSMHALADVLTDEAGTVVQMLGTLHDITERRRLQDTVSQMAFQDPLTGLANRRLYLERLRQASYRATTAGADEEAGVWPTHRAPRTFVVCFLDLDDFKAVNDAHGHGAGDRLLLAIGNRLSDAVGPGDTVARFGGDEFAILLEDTTLTTAQTVLDRLLEALSLPVDIGNAQVVAHASIGLSISTESHRATEDLLAEADAAMYAAKGSGGNSYEIFHPEMRAAAEVRSRIRTDLDAALGHDEFYLQYQPIVDLESGRRTGVEALIRWMHPEWGVLRPADFIDHAEVSGQIGPIGEWALRAACTATVGLPSDVYTSVNISARQLRLPRLADVVAQVLESSGLAPERLVLEITETATVSDLSGAVSRLRELKALGVAIALDDFGTGYSPLTHLRSFPVDILKIDRSFVRDVEHSTEDRSIISGIIEMARDLGLCTIAEGIETQWQRDIMRDLGCDAGQGYLWTKPASLESLVAGAGSASSSG